MTTNGTNDVTFRITLTYDEALVVEKLFAGITPTNIDELDMLVEVETRFLRNLDRYRAAELLRKSREERILRDLSIRPPDTSKQEAKTLEILKQMAISKGEYTDESAEQDRTVPADAG